MGDDVAIRCRDLTKVYATGITGGRVTALDGLTCEVRRHEIFGLLGPNGAGKTTLLKILLGLIYPTAGSAMVLGAPPGDVASKQRIGFLPEGPYFYDYLTADEFLHFYGQLFRLPVRERSARIDALMKLVGLGHARSMRLRRFSKGMLQRIGLAQALINGPELVILDEPMSGLDPVGRKDLKDIILRLRDEGVTVFFSSHILTDAERLCDRVAIIHRGRLAVAVDLRDLAGRGGAPYAIRARGVPPGLAVDLGRQGATVQTEGDVTAIGVADRAAANAVVARLVAAGCDLVSAMPVPEALEDLFARVVGAPGEVAA